MIGLYMKAAQGSFNRGLLILVISKSWLRTPTLFTAYGMAYGSTCTFKGKEKEYADAADLFN